MAFKKTNKTETADDKDKKITFFSKKPFSCPVCTNIFYKEELFSGGGRLSAGDLTDDLRRIYEPSRKFGEIYPLVYEMMTCPECLYSAQANDFFEIDNASKEKILADAQNRKDSIAIIFPDLNLNEPRRLDEGAASYIASIMCYDFMDKKYSPTIKQALASIRAAWVFDDMHRKNPVANYDYLAKLFYRKAGFFYSVALEKEQNGKEPLSGLKNLGPDLDKNYGYEGLLYLVGFLEYTYGPKGDVKRRFEKLEGVKRVVAKMHGIGKASKNKPSVILNKSKALFDLISNELIELKKELV